MKRPPVGLLALIAVGPSAALLALTAVVYSWARIDPPERLDEGQRAAVIAALRASLEGQAPGTLPDRPAPGPVVVTLWLDGVELERAIGRGATLAGAVGAAGAAIAASPAVADLDAPARRRARLEVHRVTGYGPLVRSIPALELFSLHPGVDGVAVELASTGDEVLLLPHDLVRLHLLTAEKPLGFIPDLKIGVDHAGIEKVAAVRAGMAPSAWRARARRWRRFRTDAFVEPPVSQRPRAPISLYRGSPPRPPLSSRALREGALAGGRYLVSKLAPSGRYIYESDLASGRGTDPRRAHPYSLPRHAGTTYFLAELYRITGEESLREPIERAFAHLVELVEKGGCEGTLPSGREFACVVDKGQRVAGLGSSALAVVALVEFKRATGDSSYDPLARRLSEWILYMQREDGSFAHQYNLPRAERDEEAEMLYFSGEAALALARMHEVHGDPRYLEATERALDWLVGWYDFFAGAFFYGEEHWTCIAAEAIWPALKRDRYRVFCDGYGEFLRLQQPRPADFPDQPDLVGTYGFTPFVIPNNTPAGSRTEAMLSAYLLGLYHGKPSAPLRQQILAAMHFALGQQVDARGDFWMPGDSAIGAISASPVDPTVRIDMVQHVCSAMIRTAELLDGKVRSGAPDPNRD
jgi:hypothetical protein